MKVRKLYFGSLQGNYHEAAWYCSTWHDLSPADESHERAVAFAASFEGRLVTNEWVMDEVGDALSRVANRKSFVRLFRQLTVMPDFTIVSATLGEGIELFAAHPDKDWSLTDCISFAVMNRSGVSQALTGDHHFEQAGFTALLKQ